MEKEDDIDFVNSISFTVGRKLIKPRSKKQLNTLIWSKIKKWFFVVALPGQGKLIFFEAFAVSMLKSGLVDKIILTRPRPS